MQGELWSVTDRLAYDWGFAGYKQGQPLPTPPVTHNLKVNFGAKGDGRTDDTAALVRALAVIPNGGVLLIPAGD